MKPYVSKVLRRDCIPFHEVEEGYIISITSRGYADVIEDAKCLVEQEERNDGIPVITWRTFKNPEKFSRLVPEGDFIFCKQDKEFAERKLATL